MPKIAIFSPIALVIASVFAVLSIGCGGDTQADPLSEIDLGSKTLARCLEDNGAQFAREQDELAFFDEDSASMFATYFDQSAKLFVKIWQDGEDPREWLMWQAQPFDEEETPQEIVDSSSAESYVAYILHPSDDQRQSLDTCTK